MWGWKVFKIVALLVLFDVVNQTWVAVCSKLYIAPLWGGGRG